MIPQSLKHVAVTSVLGAFYFLSTRCTQNGCARQSSDGNHWRLFYPILLGEETPCTYPVTSDIQTIAQEQRGRKPPPTLCIVLVSGQDHEDHARRPDHLLPGLTQPGEPAALGCGLTAHCVCVEEVRSISKHDPHLSWVTKAGLCRLLALWRKYLKISILRWWETMDSYFLCTF